MGEAEIDTDVISNHIETLFKKAGTVFGFSVTFSNCATEKTFVISCKHRSYYAYHITSKRSENISVSGGVFGVTTQELFFFLVSKVLMFVPLFGL